MTPPEPTPAGPVDSRSYAAAFAAVKGDPFHGDPMKLSLFQLLLLHGAKGSVAEPPPAPLPDDDIEEL